MTKDPQKVAALYGEYEKSGEIRVDEATLVASRHVVLSAAVSEETTLAVIRHFDQEKNYLLDPHSGQIHVYICLDNFKQLQKHISSCCSSPKKRLALQQPRCTRSRCRRPLFAWPPRTLASSRMR